MEMTRTALASKPLKPFQGLKLLITKLTHRVNTASASKPLKPFQGLKPIVKQPISLSIIASKPLKPFQGLKPCSRNRTRNSQGRFKASETLLGIETNAKRYLSTNKMVASKPLKPFQGLKLVVGLLHRIVCIASKPLKPFQGLKLVARQIISS